MGSVDELYQLISLLSKAEKRQFKLMASTSSGKESNYTKLFDYLSKQEEYEEEQLVKKFKDEAFIHHLSSTKHKLYLQILKSLTTLSTGNPIDRELNEMQAYIEILYYKGLLKQSQRWLNKAKNIAYQYEKFTVLLNLFSWEKRLLHERQNENLTETYEQIINEEKEVMNKLQNVLDYQNLNFMVTSYSATQFRIRSEKDELFLQKFGEEALVKEDCSKSLSAKLLYYEVRYKFLLKSNIHNEAWNTINKAIQLFKKQASKLVDSDVETFLRIHMNFINISILTGNMEAVENSLEEIKIHSEKSGYHEIKTKEKFFYTQLLYYMNSYQWEKAHQIALEFKEFIKDYEYVFKKTKLLIIKYNISMLYFLRQDYNESLYWLNNILNQPKTELRKDSQITARIMRMLVFYELDNKDLIDDLVRSTQRHLAKNNYQHDFEMIMLSFLKDLTSVVSNAEVIEKCKELEQRITEMDKTEKVKQIGQDEVLLWIKSKVQKKKIAEILQGEKAVK